MSDSTNLEPSRTRIAPRLVDALYTETLLLADEARTYFDDVGRCERDSLEPFARVGFACEALRVTTRIMHVIAWLLTERAATSGELERRRAAGSGCRLGNAASSDPAVVEQMPETAQQLIVASSELYARVRRIEQAPEADMPRPSPARALMGRLERDFAASAA